MDHGSDDRNSGFITPQVRGISHSEVHQEESFAPAPRTTGGIAEEGGPSGILLLILGIMVAIHAYVLLVLILVQRKSQELDARVTIIEQKLGVQTE
jgi:hypothetical protein